MTYEEEKAALKAKLIAAGKVDVLDTNELTAQYEVDSFGGGLCFATNRTTGEHVSFDYENSPRIYWRYGKWDGT